MGRAVPEERCLKPSLSPEPDSGKLPQQRALDTRRVLVDTTVRILREHGIGGFTTLNVAREAGVSRGALRYHFPSPEALLVAARMRVVEMMFEEIPVPIQSDTISGRVNELVDRYWRVFGADDYIVAIEIRLYERFSVEAATIARTPLEEATEIFNREWVRVFAASALDTDRLVALRIYMLDVLRGLALRRIEGGAVDAFRSELSLLKQTLTAFLKG